MANDDLHARIQQLERELDGVHEPRTTWFLEPGRAGGARLEAQVAAAAASPVVEALLRTGAGAVAVLNEQRQVLALNAEYLALLGVDEPGAILGLRIGEAVRCVHAAEQLPGGCGTSVACRTCGAAVSILAALEGGGPLERDCAFTVHREGALVDAEFRARAQTIEVPPERFILLALTDVSLERRRAALERALFHDLAEMLDAIVGACDAMDGSDPAEVTLAAADARDVAQQVARELRLQRALMSSTPTPWAPERATVPVEGILGILGNRFRHHPAAAGKRLWVSGNGEGALLETDPFLVQRVVGQMLLNAFEASPAGAEVRLTVEAGVRDVAFRVANGGVLPAAVAARIFQRYFTTRGDPGRGQGTFAMKFLGERVLGGRVRFTSAPGAGTTFELLLPRRARS